MPALPCHQPAAGPDSSLCLTPRRLWPGGWHPASSDCWIQGLGDEGFWQVTPLRLTSLSTTGPSLMSICLLLCPPLPQPGLTHAGFCQSSNTASLCLCSCSPLPRVPFSPNFYLFPNTQFKSPSSGWPFLAATVHLFRSLFAPLASQHIHLYFGLLSHWTVICVSIHLSLFLEFMNSLDTESQSSWCFVLGTKLEGLTVCFLNE